VSSFLELSFDLGSIDAQRAEEACLGLGACAVTFVDARDDAVLEPAPGELRLWPATRLRCLFAAGGEAAALQHALGAALGLDAAAVAVETIADRPWEREWLRDFHPLRFGRRLWVRPHHEKVSAPDAVVVTLDPGLAFGTGSHASTALCLAWLDANPPTAARVIDFGCGSGILALAAAQLGAAEVHCFDRDPQALTATRDNAAANALAGCLHIHESAATLPEGTDVLLANILAETLCSLAGTFATLVRPGGEVVLGGLLDDQAPQVTGAYSTCFDVERFGERDGWVCLVARRR